MDPGKVDDDFRQSADRLLEPMRIRFVVRHDGGAVDLLLALRRSRIRFQIG